ncbi:VQ motif-containing protein 4-like [Rhododendron vialii]|uniref:VQ motif-containing protein 4-like n=1 Tax=Rhododendron vialii TaxID=182163 RepID=UPI00265EE877|nr:VQ motif-containing protein 4-like [Rhododendron vialii]
MEITSRPQERENPSPTTSPTSNITNTSSSSNNNNGLLLFHTTSQTQTTTPPLTPKQPISRSEQPNNNNNPYPTTFVQADPNTFKQVVQMLTGSPDTANLASKHPDPPQSRNHIPPIKKQGFKLYERRNSHNLRNGLVISPLVSGSGHNSGFSPRSKEILSPSILNFPGLVLSPVTPLVEYPSSDSSSPSVEEDKAIAEKGFYLHPSPRASAGGSEPRLLPLFPVTSPRVSNQTEP